MRTRAFVACVALAAGCGGGGAGSPDASWGGRPDASTRADASPAGPTDASFQSGLDAALPACAATKTPCGTDCCRTDQESCFTNRLDPKCVPHWGYPWTELRVTFGESGLIEPSVQALPGGRARWAASSLLLDSTASTLAFSAAVEYEPGAGELAGFVGAALLAQVEGRCFFPQNDAMHVKASRIVAIPPTCATADSCAADFSFSFEPVVCPDSTELLAYAVSFSWLRVFSSASGRTYQWLQSDSPRGCPPDQSCDTQGTFFVYAPLAESQTDPIDEWKGQTFDYVAWTRQNLGGSPPDAGP